MDNKTIFVLTQEGEDELNSRTSYLPEELRRVLALVDGKSEVGKLKKRAAPSLRPELFSLLWKLVNGGYIQYADKSPALTQTKQSPLSMGTGALSTLREWVNGGLNRYMGKVRNMRRSVAPGTVVTCDKEPSKKDVRDPAFASEVLRYRRQFPASVSAEATRMESQNRKARSEPIVGHAPTKASNEIKAAHFKSEQEAAAVRAQIEIAEAEAEAALYKATLEATEAKAQLEIAEAEANAARFKSEQEAATAKATIDAAMAHAEAEARVLAEAEATRLRAGLEAAAAKVQLETAKAEAKIKADAKTRAESKAQAEAEISRDIVADRGDHGHEARETSGTTADSDVGGSLSTIVSALRKNLFDTSRDTEDRPESRAQNAPKEDHITRIDALNKVLQTLQNSAPGIEAGALISSDGIVIASVFDQDMDVTRIGAMTSTLLSLGTRAGTELHRGELRDVIVSGELGYAVMVSAGVGVSLLVLATETTPLGFIFLEIDEAVKAIKAVG